MEDKKVIEIMKRCAALAKEEKDKDSHHVIIGVINALIEAGLIDKDGNIIEKPENTGKQK